MVAVAIEARWWGCSIVRPPTAVTLTKAIELWAMPFWWLVPVWELARKLGARGSRNRCFLCAVPTVGSKFSRLVRALGVRCLPSSVVVLGCLSDTHFRLCFTFEMSKLYFVAAVVEVLDNSTGHFITHTIIRKLTC